MTIRAEVGLLGTNAYIHAPDGGPRAAIIDPGGSGADLAELAAEKGLEIAAVILTHGHADHSAGCAELLAALAARGQRPPLCVHPGDSAYLGAGGWATNRRLLSAIGAEAMLAGMAASPLPAPDVLLEDGRTAPGTDLRVMHVPGHSPGSICLICDRDRLVYTGDLLFRSGIGRTDAPDASPALMAASLERILALEGEWRCLPGHGPETSLGRERSFLIAASRR